MAGGYSHDPDGIKGLVAKIDGLQRQINALRGTAPSNSTTITDADGSPQIHLGQLDSGGYGIEQVVNGSWVPLAALAGGAQAASVPNIDLSGNTGYTPGDGSITFTTYTGKYLLIIVVGQAIIINAIAQVSFRARGAHTFDPPPSGEHASAAGIGTAGSLITSQVYAEVCVGDPGEVTVTPMFKVGSAGSASADWSAISLIVLPF